MLQFRAANVTHFLRKHYGLYCMTETCMTIATQRRRTLPPNILLAPHRCDLSITVWRGCNFNLRQPVLIYNQPIQSTTNLFQSLDNLVQAATSLFHLQPTYSIYNQPISICKQLYPQPTYANLQSTCLNLQPVYFSLQPTFLVCNQPMSTINLLQSATSLF